MKQRQLIVAAEQRNLVQCAGWARPNAGQASYAGASTTTTGRFECFRLLRFTARGSNASRDRTGCTRHNRCMMSRDAHRGLSNAW